MTKIPVGATIAHAYRFAFTNFVSILGISLMPLAIMMVGIYLLRDTMATLNLASATKNFALMQGKWGPLLLFYVAAILLITMQMTGLMQLALGRFTGPRWFYFSVAKPLWRLIGGVLLAGLALLAVAIAYVIAVFVLALLLNNPLSGSPTGVIVKGLLLIVAFVVGYCGFIYAMLRFFFLLAPVIIAEDRVAVFRAWSLSRGNFWRIFLIILALLLPIIIVEVAGMFALGGPMPVMPAGNTAADMQALQQTQALWQVNMQNRMQSLWYIAYPVIALVSVLFYGATCAAQAFAYRVVSGSAPVAGDGLPD